MPSGVGEGDEKEQSQGQEGNRENAGKKKGSRAKQWSSEPNAAKSTKHGLKMKMCHGLNQKEVTSAL